MPLKCEFCHKDWVQPCWDANEAASCGNLTEEAAKHIAKRAQQTAAAIGKRKKARRTSEADERALYERLKAKFEPDDN